MAEDANAGKIAIKEAVENLETLHRTRPNSLWMRLFIDAKSDEIIQIFTGGPRLDIAKMADNLKSYSPSNSTSWNKLRF